MSESGDEGGRAALAGAAALLTEDIRRAATEVAEAELDVGLIAERIDWIDDWLDRLRVVAAHLPWDAVDELGRAINEAVEAGGDSDCR